VEALDWSTVRGLALRHLRWWSEQPISDRDGVMSVGYGYDNRRMSESYNSAGSPYWCMKGFAMLAAPDEHPFWNVAEAAPAPPATIGLRDASMIVSRDASQAVAFIARAGGWSFVEEADAKYQKLAYSSRFGFSGDFALYGISVTDSMLAVVDPRTGVRGVRSAVELADVSDEVALARWSPLPGVRIDTAIVCGAPWHARLHRIVTDRQLALSETGFALPWEPEGFGPERPATADDGRAIATSRWGASTIVDIAQGSALGRTAELRALSPNANVMHPHVIVPALDAVVGPGTHWLGCAVGASDDTDAVDVNKAPTVSAQIVDKLESFSARAAA
jgi:uncharacterized protein DUF2264